VDRPTEATNRPAPGPPPGPTTPPPAEPLQRWRLTFARDPVPAELVGRAAMDAWQETLASSTLPLAGLEPTGSGRARFALGTPLPAAAAGRAELADIWLLERRPAWAVREALEARMPPAHRYVTAENVWLGAPPLPGQIVAARWSVTLAAPAAARDAIDAASRRLLDAETVPRVRTRGGGDRPYDLRPLLEDVGPTGPRAEDALATLRMTTRFDPALGAGRPEEVVAAIGEIVGTELPIAALVRDALILADPQPAASSPRPTTARRRPRP
jgi:hypothetical protein